MLQTWAYKLTKERANAGVSCELDGNFQNSYSKEFLYTACSVPKMSRGGFQKDPPASLLCIITSLKEGLTLKLFGF